MEPIVIAFYRQFSENHNLYKFMRPHFKHTLAINDLGRSTLLRDENSSFDRILGKSVMFPRLVLARRSRFDPRQRK